MKIQKKQSGFTLVELITVVSLLALLTIFVAREMGQSADGVKVNLVAATLMSSVPAAIVSHKAANVGNCTIGVNAAELISRGVPALSPWGTAGWGVVYVPATRLLTVNYPLTGVANLGTVGPALATLLSGNAAFVNPQPVMVNNDIVVTYRC
ncbi:MAG: hypothetical protein COA99_15015 [Moraxellaceae bacterium]|nr:MAG: hypothetical protein COA99_15015 [Moraxellaceae bacterium]